MYNALVAAMLASIILPACLVWRCCFIGRVLRIAIAIVLLACIVISTIKILDITGMYSQEEAIRKDMLIYKPEFIPLPPEGVQPSNGLDNGLSAPLANQGVVDAQNIANSDIVGWLTIPNTAVDYLFVQAEDNDFYLSRDLYRQRASAGSIFMDYRNSKDFTDFNTILYGHHMKNGSMFQSLRKFRGRDFFNANLTGTIFLAHGNYTLQIFAYMVVQADDSEIYNGLDTPQTEREGFFSYVKANAEQYRDLGLTHEDRVVTLSSCSYEFSDARMVLLARLVTG